MTPFHASLFAALLIAMIAGAGWLMGFRGKYLDSRKPAPIQKTRNPHYPGRVRRDSTDD